MTLRLPYYHKLEPLFTYSDLFYNTPLLYSFYTKQKSSGGNKVA